MQKSFSAHLMEKREAMLHKCLIHLIGNMHQWRILTVETMCLDKLRNDVGHVFVKNTLFAQDTRRNIDALDLEELDLGIEFLLEKERFVAGLSLVNTGAQCAEESGLLYDLLGMVPGFKFEKDIRTAHQEQFVFIGNDLLLAEIFKCFSGITWFAENLLDITDLALRLILQCRFHHIKTIRRQGHFTGRFEARHSRRYDDHLVHFLTGNSATDHGKMSVVKRIKCSAIDTYLQVSVSFRFLLTSIYYTTFL